MDDGKATASNVAGAIAVSLDSASSSDARRAAVAYLDSVKGGDIRVFANTSLLLIHKDYSSEIRLHGFKMLQHLVRFRWHEFSIQERSEFARVAFNLIMEMANPLEEWALKSQATSLVAEVVRREGAVFWQELLPSLVSLSNKGPVEAELVSMILRWLPEDITVHNEDLEGDRRRVLLRGLTESLTDILPLLYSLLERHFGAALSEYNRQQLDVAKKHAATVTAVLNAINAYAEWAPLLDLAKYHLILGCGLLLSSPEFRLHACEFFKLMSQRKRPQDAIASEFNSAMVNTFQVLMQVSGNFLNKFGIRAVVADESEFEFAERICESMVVLGSSHLLCIAWDGNMTSQFLQLMMGYFQHYKFGLHFQSLLFWLTLMRESVSKGRYVLPTKDPNLAVDNPGLVPTQSDKEKKGLPNFVNDDICAVLLDVSLQRMIKKSNTPGYLSNETLELWSDEFDGSDFGQYRSRLLELIRLVASQKPVVAAVRISHRLDIILVNSAQPTILSEAVALLESMQAGLEAVVIAIFDGSTELNHHTSEIKFQLHVIFEGLLQQLLSQKWAEPPLTVLLAHYLDALGPYLKFYPESITTVVNKLFELLTSLPLTLKDPSNIARHARLQVCTSFIRIAKAAQKSLLPLMKGIADTMALLQAEGRLLRGEHNLLGEAFLVMASSAGIQQQQEVLSWLLEPLSKQWIQLEWQNAYLSDPLGLKQLCSDPQFMWNIFHTVTFFEKALKRSGYNKANWNPHDSPSIADGSNCRHPMSFHLAWMLPPLFRLLRIIHSLWSPTIAQALTVELIGAKYMSQVEQASLLGESGLKLPKGQLTHADGSQIDMHREEDPNENDIRNWLKGIRDSGYNVIGLSANIGDCFFRGFDCSILTMALMENVQSMDFRHIRQLIHLVLVPIVKLCPADLRVQWLENLLHPLFLHCQQALSYSWSSFMHEGRAKVPDTFISLPDIELKLEVMEEKLLRDLTREICNLLLVLASPALNSGLPSLEQLGNVNRTESSSLNSLDAFSTNSIMGFLLTHKSLALPALRICIEAFTWTDGEAVAKVASFCEAVILLAISTDNVELREFVVKDLFYAILQALFLESNAVISSDLVGLCREIYVYLSHRDSSPRQILLSLPFLTEGDLVAFEDALSKTSSPKEQKLLMRSLLQLATGNKLRALACQKSTSIITNVTDGRLLM
ncbi:protein HASTY 1 isoform X2 [Phalaenopsis equestris]|uniref:protein HASTY 1 isoform X2 n=1 Tax=Phalaenopsis equestris TaxID=78828 RepID=UPI0009E57268|nr:protein HASTY 1 isoform X2 [Phalaenopsis equestris]